MSYVRVSILGATVGNEVWSINPVYDPTGEFPGGVDQVALDLAAVQIAALSPGVNLLGGMSTAMSITGARVEVRDDTTDDLIGISVATRPAVLVGTGTPKMPAQAASVISLRTNTPGGSGRGRLYWPALGQVIGTNLRLVSTTTDGILSGFKTYSGSIRSILATNFTGIGFDLAVRSRATHTTPHVVRAQCGDVIDTQRRRRDSLAEAYSSISFP